MNTLNRHIRRAAKLIATFGALGLTGSALAQHINNPLGGARSSVSGWTVTIDGNNDASFAGTYDLLSQGNAPMGYGAAAVTPANFVSWANTNPGEGSGYTRVDAMHETLRVASAVASLSGKTVENTNTASFSGTEILVGAGSSGLSIGAPVTLTVNVRVDGTQSVALNNPLQAYTLPSSYAYAAQAYIGLFYRVFDLDQGNETPILYFGYEANMFYGVERRWLDETSSYVTLLTDRYSSSANYMTDGGWVSGHDETAGVTGQDITNVLMADVPKDRTQSFDTGIISISFDTFIGHTLMIGAGMTSRSMGQGILPMRALSDYGNTFDADITSEIPGIQLIGITPGVASVPEGSVPEPSSHALLLAGLGLMVAMRGRKHRRA